MTLFAHTYLWKNVRRHVLINKVVKHCVLLIFGRNNGADHNDLKNSNNKLIDVVTKQIAAMNVIDRLSG